MFLAILMEIRRIARLKMIKIEIIYGLYELDFKDNTKKNYIIKKGLVDNHYLIRKAANETNENETKEKISINNDTIQNKFITIYSFLLKLDGLGVQKHYQDMNFMTISLKSVMFDLDVDSVFDLISLRKDNNKVPFVELLKKLKQINKNQKLCETNDNFHTPLRRLR